MFDQWPGPLGLGWHISVLSITIMLGSMLMLQIVIIDSITSHYSHLRPDAASYLNISYQDLDCQGTCYHINSSTVIIDCIAYKMYFISLFFCLNVTQSAPVLVISLNHLSSVLFWNKTLIICSNVLFFSELESQFNHRKVTFKRNKDVRSGFDMLCEIGRYNFYTTLILAFFHLPPNN